MGRVLTAITRMASLVSSEMPSVCQPTTSPGSMVSSGFRFGSHSAKSAPPDANTMPPDPSPSIRPIGLSLPSKNVMKLAAESGTAIEVFSARTSGPPPVDADVFSIIATCADELPALALTDSVTWSWASGEFVPRPTPPAARTRNWSRPVEVNGPPVLSAQTKVPRSPVPSVEEGTLSHPFPGLGEPEGGRTFASTPPTHEKNPPAQFAWPPLIVLATPIAVFCEPPDMELKSPDVKFDPPPATALRMPSEVFPSPPPTEAPGPAAEFDAPPATTLTKLSATLLLPPPTAAPSPLAMLPWPPLTVAFGEVVRLLSPPLIAAFGPLTTLLEPPPMVAPVSLAELPKPPAIVDLEPIAIFPDPPPTVACSALFSAPDPSPDRLLFPPPIVP